MLSNNTLINNYSLYSPYNIYFFRLLIQDNFVISFQILCVVNIQHKVLLKETECNIVNI